MKIPILSDEELKWRIFEEATLKAYELIDTNPVTIEVDNDDYGFDFVYGFWVKDDKGNRVLLSRDKEKCIEMLKIILP
jgi:hypothetical protein